MSDSERWLPVPGYEGIYEISDRSRVRSLKRVTEHGLHGAKRSLGSKALKTSRNNGYLVAYLGGNGRTGKSANKLYVEAAVESLFGVRPIQIDEVSLPGEEWRDIAAYESIYQISSLGRVRSVGRHVRDDCSIHINSGNRRRYLRPHILPGGIGTPGYWKVDLSTKGRMKTFLVHRLVAAAFIQNPLNLEVVHHKDENKLNNRADNLEWVTRASNVQDWFDRRRVVITQDAITRIGDALAAGKSPAEILASLPRKRKTKNKG